MAEGPQGAQSDTGMALGGHWPNQASSMSRDGLADSPCYLLEERKLSSLPGSAQQSLHLGVLPVPCPSPFPVDGRCTLTLVTELGNGL